MVQVNLSKGLDKAYEDKSLAEILAAPPSALLGLTPKHDEMLAELKIKTVADLGNWQHAVHAQALVTLADAEVPAIAGDK
jgi:hypothetical protein